jgi:hypothetical protein
MPKKTKPKKEEESFNWKGIKDNGDGTFDVADKRAKNRIQREFRRQGIRTRSQRTGVKGFVVYPVGQRKQRAHRMGSLPKKERQYYPGYKPKTRVRGTPGPRPQLRQGRPGFGGQVGPGRPVIRAGPRKGTGIPQAIQKAAEKRAQKVQESQRSPYTPEGKPRPGYQTYTDKTGTQRIVKMPSGTWRDRFASREQKEMQKQARVQESHKIESEMAERSKGQPSTRIPTQHEREAATKEVQMKEQKASEEKQKRYQEELRQRRVAELQYKPVHEE